MLNPASQTLWYNNYLSFQTDRPPPNRDPRDPRGGPPPPVSGADAVRGGGPPFPPERREPPSGAPPPVTSASSTGIYLISCKSELHRIIFVFFSVLQEIIDA